MRRTPASTSSIPRAARRWSRYRSFGRQHRTHRPGTLRPLRRRWKRWSTKCNVPGQMLELPIGLQATDRFIDALRTMAGVEVPDVDHRRTRTAAGHDRRHAPVLLRQAGCALRRSGPTGFAGRVPEPAGHEAGVHRHRHADRDRRSSQFDVASGRRWAAIVPEAKIRAGRAGRHVPACISGSSRSRSIC